MIGLKELALVAVVVLVLYGRSGVVKSRQFQAVWPWLSPQRRKGGRPGTVNAPSPSRARSTMAASPQGSHRAKRFVLRGNRLFWFLTFLAATAVAAWIVTRVMIASGAGPGVTH
jgi:hypothetical protein